MHLKTADQIKYETFFAFHSLTIAHFLYRFKYIIVLCKYAYFNLCKFLFIFAFVNIFILFLVFVRLFFIYKINFYWNWSVQFFISLIFEELKLYRKDSFLIKTLKPNIFQLTPRNNVIDNLPFQSITLPPK